MKNKYKLSDEEKKDLNNNGLMFAEFLFLLIALLSFQELFPVSLFHILQLSLLFFLPLSFLFLSLPLLSLPFHFFLLSISLPFLPVLPSLEALPTLSAPHRFIQTVYAARVERTLLYKYQPCLVHFPSC